MKYKAKNNFGNEEGAILITIALFMLAAGIAVAAYAYTSKIRLQDKRQAKIEEQYATIMGAMSKYVARNQGYKPCPAPIAVAETSANFGLETECDPAITPPSVTPGAGAMACNTGGAELDRYCVFNNGTRKIRFGVVPYKALKIDKEDIIDPYGNLYSYAVVEHRADGVNSPALPVDYNIITVNETQLVYNGTNWVPQATTPLTDMAVYTHGLNGRGSWLPSGIANPAGCTGAGLDIENCDNDDVFNLALGSDTGANYFDDTVAYDITAWTYIWNDSIDAVSDGIYNQGFKASGVGTKNPQSDFHVVGGNVLVEEDPTVIPTVTPYVEPTGSAVAPQYCSDSSGNCFDPSLLGAPDSTDQNADCDSDQYLRGFVNGLAQCEELTPGLAGSCATYIQGINYNGSGLTVTCGP